MTFSRQQTSTDKEDYCKAGFGPVHKPVGFQIHSVSLAAVLFGISNVGHPAKVTPLPPVLPPSPPGLVLFETRPLPQGRIYVSPKQFAGEQRDLVKASVRFEKHMMRKRR